jgi:hypothetical protein
MSRAGAQRCLSDAVVWCVCLCAHQIKNARTQLAQRLREIRARVRIIISGEHGEAQHSTAQQGRTRSCSVFTHHVGVHCDSKPADLAML